MPEIEHLPKNKKTVRNVVYAFLVFYISFFPFIAILDRSILTKPSFNPQLNVRDFLAVGLSIVAGVVFYRWFTKRNDR
jgi:hypothetical protein